MAKEIIGEGVGTEAAGALKEGVEAKTILRKGEKRILKMKWLLYQVNSGTKAQAVGESGQADGRETWCEEGSYEYRSLRGHATKSQDTAGTLAHEVWQMLAQYWAAWKRQWWRQ